MDGLTLDQLRIFLAIVVSVNNLATSLRSMWTNVSTTVSQAH